MILRHIQANNPDTIRSILPYHPYKPTMSSYFVQSLLVLESHNPQAISVVPSVLQAVLFRVDGAWNTAPRYRLGCAGFGALYTDSIFACTFLRNVTKRGINRQFHLDIHATKLTNSKGKSSLNTMMALIKDEITYYGWQAHNSLGACYTDSAAGASANPNRLNWILKSVRRLLI